MNIKRLGTVRLHRTQSKGGNIKFVGTKLTQMESLAQFEYTELTLYGAI